MSFQENRSAIDICNKALSRIGQQPLSGALDSPANLNKHAGRECNLHYKATVRRLLEQHHWNLATRRVGLVVNTVNDRSSEWLLSYAAPSDMAFPVSISPLPTSTGQINYYRGIGSLIAKIYNRPLFMFSGGTIYAGTADAELEYVSFSITEQDFSQELEDIIVEFLSSKLAFSIAKDETMGQRFEQKAVSSLNLIIANNLNQQRPRYDMLPSEAEMARNGVDPWIAGFSPGLGYY